MLIQSCSSDSKYYNVDVRNEDPYKVTHKVILHEIQDANVLKEIAHSIEEIKDKNIFIWFYLPNSDTSSVCWASAIYNPKIYNSDEYEVEIGGSQQKIHLFDLPVVVGETLGTWKDEIHLPNKVLRIYKNDKGELIERYDYIDEFYENKLSEGVTTCLGLLKVWSTLML